jgi:alpha-D-ribose 1-methylphosphonate 5-triphosphate synthase subunit PhnH
MSSAAATSSSLSTTIRSILAIPISEKLTKSNYPLWHAQVMPALRTTQLNDLLTGEEKQPDKVTTVIIDEKSIKQRNPAYTAWMAHDQAVLGYLLSSLTRETLMYVSRCTSSAQAWHMLAYLYASQSHACAVNTWIALMMTKKLHLSVIDY